MLPSVLIIIPAFNESQSLASVLESVLSYPVDVLVIDDFSSDSTYDIACSFPSVRVLSNCINIGYEKTLQRGLDYARDNNYTYCITLDADGEHDPSAIPLIIESLSSSAICVAIRSFYNRPVERYLALFFQHFFALPDPLSGLKGYNIAVLSRFDNLLCIRFIGTYTLFRSHFLSLHISSISSRTSRRTGLSRFNPSFTANFSIFFLVCKSFLVSRF